MRRTRYMSLIFLALSLAFLFLQDFRWALQMPLWEWRYDRWEREFLKMEGPVEPLPVLSDEQFSRLEQDAQRGDASALAFLALHRQHASFEQKASWAEQAVQSDPRLTWLYEFVAMQFTSQWSDPKVAARVESWITHLGRFDPGNCTPALLRAQFLQRRAPDWPKSLDSHKDADQENLLKQKEWNAAMDRAFRASRHDDYLLNAFLLEREVLTARGWATPQAFSAIGTSLGIPGIVQTRYYANLQVYLARNDERAGRLNQAIERYYLVSNFALTLRHSDELIGQLMGFALDKTVAPPMKAALEKAGREEEAAALVIRLQDDPVKAWRNPLSHTALPIWLTVLVHVFGAAVVLAAGLTSLSLIYVNAKRWIRPAHQGPLFHCMTTLENYAPLLLFAACLGLYLAYVPYAQNFHYYMTATGDLRRVEAMWSNVFPFFTMQLRSWLIGFPLENPLRGYFWWALVLVAVASLVAYLDRRRLSA